ncbi:MAG: (p)ppGpp synthetase [Roseburia sp.]|nr:(p)ppGpp synthetase [Roseburia sp.]
MIAKLNDMPNDILKEVSSDRSLTFVPPIKAERIPQEEYDQLVDPYREALTRIETRMNGLNEDYRKKYRDYPIHNIQARIKSRKSIEKKLAFRGLPITAYTARDNLTDIAGIRVICYFIEDIFSILALVKTQTDLLILKESDYIHYPKSSGYMSYHMVIGVPVYRIEGMQYYPVEIQFRTLSMDFWASMEHRICYKSDTPEETTDAFKKYSSEISEMERRMQHLLAEARLENPQEPIQ